MIWYVYDPPLKLCLPSEPTVPVSLSAASVATQLTEVEAECGTAASAELRLEPRLLEAGAGLELETGEAADKWHFPRVGGSKYLSL